MLERHFMEIADLYSKANEEIKFRDDYSTFVTKKLNIGMLNILSGKIIACDPFMISKEDRPYHQEIPVGEYPVSIIIAKNSENDDERIAAAIIDFLPLLPERWIMATKGNQNLSKLPENHVFGYGLTQVQGHFLIWKLQKYLFITL